MTHPHPEYTVVHDLRTHAWVRGDGPPLVIVPGLGCASWMYARLARELGQKRTVYVYDPPGHGDSQGRHGFPAHIEQLTDHLAEWLRVNDLSGLPVLGHSLGGEVAFDLAARYPAMVSAIIACAPTGIPANPSVTEQLLQLMRDMPHERLPLLLMGVQAYGRCGARRMWQLAQDQATHDTGAVLHQVRAPTLLINGLADRVIQCWTVRAIERDIASATVREIRDGPHALTDSHPRTVARYTLDFLHFVECAHQEKR